MFYRLIVEKETIGLRQGRC